MIFNHEHQAYKEKREKPNFNRFNGAYYYSKEITDNIIPLVKTDRYWVLVNVEGYAWDHSIVFIHNNKHPSLYSWLKDYKDLILICGVPSTCEKVAHLGTPIYLPLSVDVDYISKFKVNKKTKEIAYVGRKEKAYGVKFDIPWAARLENIPREQLLREMAKYKKVYAVGRCAIEAKVLGCEVLPYDNRFPDPDIWQVLDNKEAAYMLQEKLDEIDSLKRGDTNENQKVYNC